METFGPVATVEIVDNEDDAVDPRQRDLLRALVGHHHQRSRSRHGACVRIEAGIVHVNDQPVHDEPQMPFGGVKDSGWGRFGGTFAMDEFTEMRWVTVQRGRRPFPF